MAARTHIEDPARDRLKELGYLRDVETEARVALLVLEKQGPTRNAVVINRLRTVLDALDAARRTR